MSRKSIFEKIILWNREKNLILPNSKILVGFSGGPDSTFLLWSLSELKKILKISEIHAVHINHQLRGEESDRDEKFAKNFSGKLEIGFTSFRVNVEKFASSEKISIENSARKLRYQKFEELRKSLNFDLIATAHNSTDFAETLIFNLIRGIDRNNLDGIPTKRGKITRPILPISKKEILRILKSEKIDFVIDSSNLSNDYSRNKVRNQIFPLIREINSSFEKNIFSNFERNSENFLISEMVEFILESLGEEFSEKEYNLEKFQNLSQDLQTLVFREILERFRESSEIRISRKLIENAVRFLQASLKSETKSVNESSKVLILSSSMRFGIDLILKKQTAKFSVQKIQNRKEETNQYE